MRGRLAGRQSGIAVLTAIAIPNYTAYIARGKRSGNGGLAVMIRRFLFLVDGRANGSRQDAHQDFYRKAATRQTRILQGGISG